MKDLIVPTLKTFLLGIIALGTVLFLTAWTLDYWQAWVFIFVFLISANMIGIYLSLKDPELLKRRKQVGPKAETTAAQKLIMTVAILGNIALLIFSAFDHRYTWSYVPTAVSLCGDLLIILGFLIDFIVFKENSYGSSNIQTFEGQEVISTGPYALVRHPMYAGVLVMIIGVPLALGSFWGLLFIPLITPILVWRILDEEKLLKKELSGYIEYTQRVRYRLVPYLW